MARFTDPAGGTVDIAGVAVARIRRSLDAEAPDTAHTRVDWAQISFVQELPEAVATAIKVELKTLARLHGPDGTPVWFNAEKVQGPLRPQESEKRPGVASVIIIANKRQPVQESGEEVARVIEAAGGKPFPPSPSGIVELSLEAFRGLRQSLMPMESWE